MPCKFCPHCQERTESRQSNPEINLIYKIGITGGFETTRVRLNRYAIFRLLKRYTKAQLENAITYAREIRGKEFAPSITSFMELESKIQKLREYYQRSNPKKTIDHSPQIIGFKDEVQNGVKVKVPIYGNNNL